MTFEEFKQSVAGELHPPEELPELLKALWYEGKGNWDRAHRIAQEVESPDGSWIHAYLHRKEGDRGNALYWYRRAGRPECSFPLEEEWGEIVRHLL